MQAYGVTDIGQARAVNQDAIFYSIHPVGNLPNLFLVADGMGGHKAGDYASSFTVEKFVEIVPEITSSNPITILNHTLKEVNLRLFRQAQSTPEMEDMGTTLVAGVCVDWELYIMNIGDSRLYLINDTIRQITRDHSYVEELVSMGKLDKKNARNHENRNVITRAVGVSPKVMADFFEVEIHKKDQILLCSDGLTNMVSDAEILHIVNSERGIEEKAAKLVELANRNGGKDNISVVLVEPDEFEV